MTQPILSNENLEQLATAIQHEINCFKSSLFTGGKKGIPREVRQNSCIRQNDGTYLVHPALHLKIKSTIFFFRAFKQTDGVYSQSRYGRGGGYGLKGYDIKAIDAVIEFFNHLYKVDGEERFEYIRFNCTGHRI